MLVLVKFSVSGGWDPEVEGWFEDHRDELGVWAGTLISKGRVTAEAANRAFVIHGIMGTLDEGIVGGIVNYDGDGKLLVMLPPRNGDGSYDYNPQSLYDEDGNYLGIDVTLEAGGVVPEQAEGELRQLRVLDEEIVLLSCSGDTPNEHRVLARVDRVTGMWEPATNDWRSEKIMVLYDDGGKRIPVLFRVDKSAASQVGVITFASAEKGLAGYNEGELTDEIESGIRSLLDESKWDPEGMLAEAISYAFSNLPGGLDGVDTSCGVEFLFTGVGEGGGEGYVEIGRVESIPVGVSSESDVTNVFGVRYGTRGRRLVGLVYPLEWQFNGGYYEGDKAHMCSAVVTEQVAMMLGLLVDTGNLSVRAPVVYNPGDPADEWELMRGFLSRTMRLSNGRDTGVNALWVE